DNIRARPIDGFSYLGLPKPGIPYTRDAFITDWRVTGPLESTSPDIESGRATSRRRVDDGGRQFGWRAFPADERGAVLTGRVTEYRGSRRVAYFHTVLPQGRTDASMDEVFLDISTADS